MKDTLYVLSAVLIVLLTAVVVYVMAHIIVVIGTMFGPVMAILTIAIILGMVASVFAGKAK